MCVCVCAQVCVCVLYQQQSVYCLLQRLTSKHAMLDLFCKLSLTKLQFSLPVLVCVLGKVAAFEGSPRWNSPTDAHTRRHGHRDGHAHTVSEEAETDGDEAKDTAPKRTTHGLPASANRRLRSRGSRLARSRRHPSLRSRSRSRSRSRVRSRSRSRRFSRSRRTTSPLS